jgi:hypothetical protein
MCIVAPGQIPALFSTPVFSEEMTQMTIAVFKLLNQVISRMPETNAALERMTMQRQLETVIAPNGQKDQLSMLSLILLSMSIFGLEITQGPGGPLPKMATKILAESA